MRTYITIWFNSEGAQPTLAVQKLEQLGFRKLTGNYDMEYSWNKEPTIEDSLSLGDKIQATLKDTNIMFKLDSL